MWCLSSPVTKNCCAALPCGPLISTLTSANPAALLGLMLRDFKLVCGSNPTCACRKALISASVGKPAAGTFAVDFDAAAAWTFAGLLVFAVTLALVVCAATAAESISSDENILNEQRMSFLLFGLDIGLGRNRKTSAIAKGLGRNLDPGSCLLTFVLVPFNHTNDASHQVDLESAVARDLLD